MNNSEVKRNIDACQADLDQVSDLVKKLGPTSNVTPYLTQYAIIRSCGTIEQAFKSIIADCLSHESKNQIKNFLNKRIREGSANPSLQNMYKFIGDFDDDWKKNFKNKITTAPDTDSLTTSLQSLVDARNDFSHGGNPSASLADILKYFSDSKRIIEFMDSVIV